MLATPSSGCWVATSVRIVLVSLAALHGNSADLTVIPAPAEPDDPPEPDDVPPEKEEEPPPQAVSAMPTVIRAESATPVRCRRSRPIISRSFRRSAALGAEWAGR